MGREAIKHLAVPPRFPAKAGHLVLTNISLPCNAGIAVRTTKRETFFTVTAREGTSTDFGRVPFSAFRGTSLAASASLLSSVTAFIGLV